VAGVGRVSGKAMGMDISWSSCIVG